MKFLHWNFVCFQLWFYDVKHIQLRLDMFDQEQDKKDLKIMTGLRVLILSDYFF